MPNLIQRISTGLKAFKSGFWGSGNWVDSNRPGNRYSSGGDWGSGFPGTSINYASLAGDLRNNSACQTVLNKIMRAWPESYPCVKVMDKSGKKVVEPNHPLTLLLMNPNDFDDDTALWGGTISDFWVDGNAYWRINRTRGGKIGEFEYVPSWCIYPERPPMSTNPGPDYYVLNVDNKRLELDPWNVVHYRFGKDPNNDMLGMSPWRSVNEEVYTDNQALLYAATTLRNKGAAWVFVSPKDPMGAFDNPELVKKKIRGATTGDNKSDVVVLDGSVDLTFPPAMKDQDLSGLRKMSESRIAALAGFPAIWCGFAVGLDHSTMANTEQAEGQAWNTIVAVQRMMGRQLTKQVLWHPRNYAYEPNTIFAGFDYSEVRALQPDKTVEDENTRKNLEAGLLTEDEARVEIGREPYTAAQKAQREAERQQAMADAQAALPPPPATTEPTPAEPKKDLILSIAAKASEREDFYRTLFEREMEEVLVSDSDESGPCEEADTEADGAPDIGAAAKNGHALAAVHGG